MALSIPLKEFKNALSVVTKFSNTRTTLPILQNILFEVDKDTLYLTASNLEMFAKVTIGVKSQESFKVAIPTKVAAEIFTNLSGTKLEIEKKPSALLITCGNFKGQLSFVEPTDFPEFTVQKNPGWSLPLEDFLEIYSKVGFAVSADESRPVLTGVCFTQTKDQIEVVGTDGFRLSKVVYPSDSDKTFVTIVPKGIFLQLPNFALFDSKLKVGFEKETSQVSFVVGEVESVSRLISGDYPDYNKIIPSKFQVTASMDVQDLVSAVKNAAVFARDASDVIRLTIDKKHLRVVSESSAYGNQETTLEVSSKFENTFTQESLTVAFNYRFLLDYLKTVKGDLVMLSFVNEASPCVLTDPKTPNYTHLIMPVKI